MIIIIEEHGTHTIFNHTALSKKAISFSHLKKYDRLLLGVFFSLLGLQ